MSGSSAKNAIGGDEAVARFYCDTSVLAKWYLNEARSEDVEVFLSGAGPVFISGLTLVEMQSLVARRRREGSIDWETEAKVLATVHDDVGEGHLRVEPLREKHTGAAARLFAELAEVPLRTMDALHLAVARSIETDVVITADRVMASAAEALGMETVRFD